MAILSSLDKNRRVNRRRVNLDQLTLELGGNSIARVTIKPPAKSPVVITFRKKRKKKGIFILKSLAGFLLLALLTYFIANYVTFYIRKGKKRL